MKIAVGTPHRGLEILPLTVDRDTGAQRHRAILKVTLWTQLDAV